MIYWLKRLKWVFIPRVHYFTLHPGAGYHQEQAIRYAISAICGEKQLVVNALTEVLTAPLDSFMSEGAEFIIEGDSKADEMRNHLKLNEISFTEEVR